MAQRPHNQVSPTAQKLQSWITSKNNLLYFEDTFEQYGEKSAEILVDTLSRVLAQKQRAIFVPSSGKSPSLVYRLLHMKYKNALDWNKIFVVQMDEYWQVPCNAKESMWAAIEQNLILPLGITHSMHFFDDTGSLIQSLDTYEKRLYQLGGIDVVVHGIGRNGHIGFNEPRSSWSSPTRKVVLRASTLEANFSEGYVGDINRYRVGVTLGLGVLSKADRAILLLTGHAKNSAIHQLFYESPKPLIPASSLSTNRQVTIIVDRASISQ